MNELRKIAREVGGFLKKNFSATDAPPVRSVSDGNVSTASFLEILLVDASGSMLDDDYKPSRIQAAKDASNRFVASLRAANPRAALAVISFGCTARADLAPCRVTSMPLDRIANRIQSVKANGLATNTSKALVEVRKVVEASGLPPSKCRVVMLTDGHTTMGPDPRSQAFAMKDSGVQLDVIGIGGSPRSVAESELRDIASVVDGQVRYWFIATAPDLIRKFENLALRRVY